MDKKTVVNIINSLERSKKRREFRYYQKKGKHQSWTELWTNLYAKAYVMSHDDYKVKPDGVKDENAVKGHFAKTKIFEKGIGKSLRIKVLDKYTFKVSFNPKFNFDTITKWDFKNAISKTIRNEAAMIFMGLLNKQYKKEAYYNRHSGLVHIYPKYL